MCKCVNGRQCSYCFLGQVMQKREQMKQDIIQRSANVPLIEDETDYESLINEALFGTEVIYKLANGQRVSVEYDNYGYVRPKVRQVKVLKKNLNDSHISTKVAA